MSRRAGRRRVWPIVAVVAATVLTLLVPAAPSLGTPPLTSLRTVRVVAPPAPDGALPDHLAWGVAPEIETGAAVLVGADWGGDAAVEVEVRARSGREWGPWSALRLPADHAPDPGSDEAARTRGETASDPVWIGPSQAAQIRVRGASAPPAVTVTFVEVSGGDGLAYVPPETRGIGGFASAATSQPAMVSRASWGADESMRRYVPLYADRLRFTVVHHTAGSNDYTREEADDVVRAIYAYHVESRGWDDIAYNFLVDRFGTVYEGRSGGTAEAVIGAHAAGFNDGSAGIAMIGDFQAAEPAAAAVEALDELVAWKLDVHHVDPHGATIEIAGGGSSNRHDEGERVEVPNISAHRVTNHTACPGDFLFDRVLGEDPLADRVAPLGLPKAYGGPPALREQPLTGVRPRWDVTFTEELDWRLTIRDADGALVRSTGGFAAAGVDLEWDLHDADGQPVVPGTYRAELTAGPPGDEITPVVTGIEVTEPAERRGGEDRIETAVRLSEWAFPSARRVVIAASEAFADALVATPLAGSFGSPVLLVPSGHLPEAVSGEIRRLGADEAWIVGGTARISAAVADALTADAGIEADEVHRLAGSDRFETAAIVAEKVVAREDPDEVLLALGRHADPDRSFPDALSAGAYGAEFDLPVLLTHSDFLPPATRTLLASRPWTDGIRIFGGEAAISPAIGAAAREAADGTGTFRFDGADRYDTSRLAAEDVLRRWEAEIEEEGPDPYADPVGLEVVLASGRNWPDALGAGAAADRRDAVFLLVDPEDLDRSAATGDFLRNRAERLAHVLASGGPAAIHDAVVAAVAEIVSAAGPHRDPPPTWAPDPFAPEEEPDPDTLPVPAPTITTTAPPPEN